MRWLNKNNPLINNIFFIVLFLIFLALSIYHVIFILLFSLYSLYLFLKIKNKIIIITSIIILSIFVVHYIIIKSYCLNYHFDSDKAYKVVYVEKKESNNKIIIKHKRYQIYLYTKCDIDVGDYIKINGSIEEIDDVRIKNSFNYKAYLENNLVLGIIYSDDIEIIKHKIVLNSLSSIVNDYIDKYFKDDANNLLKALIIGRKYFSEDLNNDLKENGIIHLFAISGLHVSIFILLISKLLSIFKFNDKGKDIFIIIFLTLYLFVTNFMISIIRAVLMYALNIINKHKFKYLFSSLDIASTSFIIILIICPVYIFNISFILSYLVTFIIILVSNLIKDKNNLYQILLISLIANVFTLPIIINMNYEINILSPIVNVFYISLVSSIILPLSIIVLVFPIFSFVYKYIVDVFYYFIHLTTNISINISLPHFDPYAVFIYLVILILFVMLKRKGISIILYLLFVVIFYNISTFYQGENIYFMYLNNGEASLIRLKNKNILIDCGDGYKDEVLMYLKSIGIRKLDYVFISHNHSDHCGGIDNINKDIDIKHLYLSRYDYGAYRYYKNSEILDVSDLIEDRDVVIEVLAPEREGMEENDNSLVLYFSIKKYDYHILFTGDSTNNVNDVILKNLKGREVDLIKIAHHGSNTSSSIDFLRKINVNKAVIMVGKKWKGTLPSEEVLSNLDILGIDYYLSINDYSIIYDLKKDRFLKRS